MPYLTCQSCRLTVYSVVGHSHASDDCPRCGRPLGKTPRRLFARWPGKKAEKRVEDDEALDGPAR